MLVLTDAKQAFAPAASGYGFTGCGNLSPQLEGLARVAFSRRIVAAVKLEHAKIGLDLSRRPAFAGFVFFQQSKRLRVILFCPGIITLPLEKAHPVVQRSGQKRVFFTQPFAVDFQVLRQVRLGRCPVFFFRAKAIPDCSTKPLLPILEGVSQNQLGSCAVFRRQPEPCFDLGRCAAGEARQDLRLSPL